MRGTYALPALLILFLILTTLFGTYSQPTSADPIDSNISYFINKSKESLSTGNIEAAIANLTQAVELMAPINEENYYDIAAVGDWGCTENTDKTVENILKLNPDLVIGLGDYSYSNALKCWIQKIKPIEDRIKLVLGNHENVGNYPGLSALESLIYSDASIYMSHFGLKSQYYPFNHGNVHFLVMSTDVPYEKDSPQYKFVKDDLKTASENKKVKWIIVANHRTTYPPYYGPDSSHDALIGSKFRDLYHPLFDLYHVDLVLQGHVHYYQRTYPLNYNTGNPDLPIVTDLHKNNYINPTGPIFLTVGTGGVQYGQPASLPKPYYGVSSLTEIFGALNLQIQKDGSSLEGTFYANNDINEPIAKDTFSITKRIPEFENTVPIAEFNHVITSMNNPVLINLIGRDNDTNDLLYYNIVTEPLHGNLSSFNNSTGDLTYLPNNNFTGTDLFTFRVKDSRNAESNIANVTVSVN